MESLYDPEIPPLDAYPEELVTDIQSKLAQNINSSTLHNSEMVGTTQMSIN